MSKIQDPLLQIAGGRKHVVHDRATSRAGSHHQSRMLVGWQVARLLWRLTGRPSDLSCHLWNRFTTVSANYYDQWRLVARPCIGRATSRHLLMVSYFCDPRMSKISSRNYCILPGLTKFSCNFLVTLVRRVHVFMLLIWEFAMILHWIILSSSISFLFHFTY